MMDANALYTMALLFTSGIGSTTARELIRYFGSAEQVYAASDDALKDTGRMGPKLMEAIRSEEKQTMIRAKAEMDFARKHQIRILTPACMDYPNRLKECPDAPPVLYYKGDADLNAARVVSIVGTRNATEYGKRLCSELVDALADYGVTIVSGLAYGIDGMAHKSSVKNNIPTVGILGHGLDRLYPAQHRKLAVDMLKTGGLLTEFPSGTAPLKGNFPSRNRIIAGLADVTVVVEAAIRGGALITAELANQYNRDVCAFPGSVHATFSEGCNLLIKTHRAHLISNIKDLEYLMDWKKTAKPSDVPSDCAAVNLSAKQEKIYRIIAAHTSISLDEIAHQTRLKPGDLSIVLLELEMAGMIGVMPGKQYRIC